MQLTAREITRCAPPRINSWFSKPTGSLLCAGIICGKRSLVLSSSVKSLQQIAALFRSDDEFDFAGGKDHFSNRRPRAFM